MASFKMLCPRCRAPWVVTAEPREQQTHDYPGSAATIYAEGCEHASLTPDDDLWEIFYQRRYPRREDE